MIFLFSKLSFYIENDLKNFKTEKSFNQTNTTKFFEILVFRGKVSFVSDTEFFASARA
jgi:hypothetical protein